MVQRFGDALPAEPIERPEQHQVEVLDSSVRHQLLELRPVGPCAGCLVDVLAHDLASGMLAILPEFAELVLRVLALVLGADAGVQGNADPGGGAHARPAFIDLPRSHAATSSSRCAVASVRPGLKCSRCPDSNSSS